MSCLHCAAPSFHYWVARCLTAVQILPTQDSKQYHMQPASQACKCARTFMYQENSHFFEHVTEAGRYCVNIARCRLRKTLRFFFQSGCKPLQSPTDAPHPPHKLSIYILSTLHIHINTWGHHQILQGSQDQVLWSSWSWILLLLCWQLFRSYGAPKKEWIAWVISKPERFFVDTFTPTLYWLVVSTHLKSMSQIGNLPQIGVKIKHIWNHHLVYVYIIIYLSMKTMHENTHHFPAN